MEHPGVHPGAMRWVATAAYLAAAASCLYAGMMERRRLASDAKGFRMPRFWLLLTGTLGVLALFRQSEAWLMLSQAGRQSAQSEGWYAGRQIVQSFFMGCMVLAALALLVWSSQCGRNAISRRWPTFVATVYSDFLPMHSVKRGHWPALAATVFLSTFVIMRAVSLHYVDHVLEWRIAGLKLNWILELGGIFAVGASALAAGLALRRNEGSAGGASPRVG